MEWHGKAAAVTPSPNKPAKAHTSSHSAKCAAAADVDINEPKKAQKQEAKKPHISWTGTHIDRVIDWMENNPVDHQKLFSDLTQAAKDKNHKKVIGKTSKSHFHEKIAHYVFSVDEDPSFMKVLCHSLHTL